MNLAAVGMPLYASMQSASIQHVATQHVIERTRGHCSTISVHIVSARIVCCVLERVGHMEDRTRMLQQTNMCLSVVHQGASTATVCERHTFQASTKRCQYSAVHLASVEDYDLRGMMYLVAPQSTVPQAALTARLHCAGRRTACHVPSSAVGDQSWRQPCG